MATFSMTPAAGEKCLRFVGDRLQFTLRPDAPLPAGWRAMLRTNLGRAAVLREEIIHSHFRKLPLAGASWRDVPMHVGKGEWSLDLPLTEVGFFRAKAYAVDPHGRQHWPDGTDVGIAVHPDAYRTANTIYCAFVRMFGENRTLRVTKNENFEAQLNQLDRLGFAVIPPSGKLRDLVRQLPHIVDTLGCRIIHLLPINPTPTTKARMGRFGSPYASQDLLAIDPALVEHENRTTGVDQFKELTFAAHLKGARIFIDLAINHTGWGSTLQENHPEWFLKDQAGEFVSPGAWGVTWGDLVELEQTHVALWDYLAEVFIEWCRRGVDGFRCDAGYKVPMPAWQYITSRVREEFPDALFLLEGLGGAWELTENLLGDGGMQWAYSELFQEFNGAQVAGYLGHAHTQSARAGVLVHYSETHDNLRLAARGRDWSLMRNRLSALTSVCGGYGFTCGVEWLATEKIFVHQANGLAWGSAENIVDELAQLNRLLADHPCFFDGAKLTRLSKPASSVFALARESADGKDRVLVIANTDAAKEQVLRLDLATLKDFGELKNELLGQKTAKPKRDGDEALFTIPAAGVFCLSAHAKPVGLSGDAYRQARAQAAWGTAALRHVLRLEQIGSWDWAALATRISENPEAFLGCAAKIDPEKAHENLAAALDTARDGYAPVVTWQLGDRSRILLVPPKHWLLIRDTHPFRAELRLPGAAAAQWLNAVRVRDGYIACAAPATVSGDASLRIERFTENDPHVTATLRFLSARPDLTALHLAALKSASPVDSSVVLLTNGRGGMARLRVDLGAIESKYDCALGANLHPTLPVDRHVFAKRIRVWCNADGFITPLNAQNLVEFTPGPPAAWCFVANAGDGRSVEVRLLADMLPNRNTTLFRFERPATPPPVGRELPPDCAVSLIVRVDIEDRSFHAETQRNGGAEHHFSSNTRALKEEIGFVFSPAEDRVLHVEADSGVFHPAVEWCMAIPHRIEQTRGQTGHGDAFSPGWFQLPLARGTSAAVALSADLPPPKGAEISRHHAPSKKTAKAEASDPFGAQLENAARAFVVRRDDGKTVIAGYPWFLDWGRDSLICARGLLAAGMHDEVLQLVKVFGRFEENGTLPNTIHGANASNRDTTDAPLWYGMVCEDAAATDSKIYSLAVDKSGRTIADVLRSIAVGYLRGTLNQICVDPGSALVWSPSHFTWMDTNYPAGTPREGYPVEIQVLWIRLLRQLERIGAKPDTTPWGELAKRAENSLQKFFWLERKGWFADVLLAKAGTPAVEAMPDDALRSNMLFVVSLGFADAERARRCVDAAAKWLVIPGALRSLAPLEVSVPLEIRTSGGSLLNDPPRPYWPRYEGDEDTRRKPAYHNGTAWTWTFPTFCEALARAWDFSPEAVEAARAYLGSVDRLLTTGCLGHVPEVVDGDAPHTERGCDAQAWGATEVLRVWRLLEPSNEKSLRR